jgi:hypothetical protein
MRLKYAGLYGNGPAFEEIHEAIINCLGLFGRRRLVERGSPSFTAVAVEGKLRNNQEGPADVCHAEIHLAGIIAKYAEAN